MPYPQPMTTTNTFNQWFDATNNLISELANSNYVLLAGRTTNSASTTRVNGAFSAASLTVSGLSTLSGNVTIAGNLVVQSTAVSTIFNGETSFDKSIAVNQNATVSGNLAVTKVATISGNLTVLGPIGVSGAVTATSFSGSLNADNLGSGTVPVARLQSASASQAGIVTTGTQTFAGSKTFQDTLAASGQLSVAANAAFDTNLLFVDAVNNRVGVKTTTPEYDLEINGTIKATSYIGSIAPDTGAIANGTLAYVKLSNDTAGRVLMTNATGNVQAITISGDAGISAAGVLTINSSSTLQFTGLRVSGAGNVVGTFGISGAANALGALGVEGTFTALGASTLTGASNALSTFGVTGTLNALGALGVSGTFTALGSSTLTGTANALNTFGVTGAANALGTLGVGGVFTALGASTLTGAANALNTFGVTGTLNALGALGVSGTLTALGQLSVAGNATFDTNVLFVDAVNNRVGIGNTSPLHTLRVNGNVSITNEMTATNFYAAQRDALGQGGALVLQGSGSTPDYIFDNFNVTANTVRLYADPDVGFTFDVFAVGTNTSSITVDGGKSFKIRHPLPALQDTHYLIHSAIESPRVENYYRGTAVLANGTAVINLDTASRMSEGTFILLNRDAQCFTTNESDWTPVKGTIVGNQLTILAQDPNSNASVSWLVVGERHDRNMYWSTMTDNTGRLIVEPEQ